MALCLGAGFFPMELFVRWILFSCLVTIFVFGRAIPAPGCPVSCSATLKSLVLARLSVFVNLLSQ
jgi:hypothetical protein